MSHQGMKRNRAKLMGSKLLPDNDSNKLNLHEKKD